MLNKNRNDVTCLHPNCSEVLARGRSCCGRHWQALTGDYRHRLARAKGVEELGALKAEIRDWFLTRMIGENEITICRGKDCGRDIVWLPTRRGNNMPVDVDGVLKTDDLFIPARHTSHFDTCVNADGFRACRR